MWNRTKDDRARAGRGPRTGTSGSIRPAVLVIAVAVVLVTVAGVRWLTVDAPSDAPPGAGSTIVAPAPQQPGAPLAGKPAPDDSAREARRLARKRAKDNPDNAMTGQRRRAGEADPAARDRVRGERTGEIDPKLVERAHRERDPADRIEAIRSLVEAGGSSSLPLLAEVLRTDGDVDVRLAVIESLPDTAAIDAPPESRSYVDLLIEALRDPSSDIREAAGYQLGFEEDARIPPALRDAYDAEADENVKGTIGDSLEFLGGEILEPETDDQAG